jgi:hypothetical protein
MCLVLMEDENKLPLVKASMKLLVEQLREQDSCDRGLRRKCRPCPAFHQWRQQTKN